MSRCSWLLFDFALLVIAVLGVWGAWRDRKADERELLDRRTRHFQGGDLS